MASPCASRGTPESRSSSSEITLPDGSLNGDDGVVEGGVDGHQPVRDVLALFRLNFFVLPFFSGAAPALPPAFAINPAFAPAPPAATRGAWIHNRSFPAPCYRCAASAPPELAAGRPFHRHRQTKSWPPPSSCWRPCPCADLCGCAHWCACAVREQASCDDDGCRDKSRFR